MMRGTPDYKTTPDRLSELAKEAAGQDIRLLIEVDLFGLMYIWCDKQNRRKVIRLIRKHEIKMRTIWKLTESKWAYPETGIKYLEKEKGPCVARF